MGFGVKLKLGSGFEELLAKVQKAGNSIDEAVKDAINEGAKPVYENMVNGAERHRDSGDVVKAIEIREAEQDGNTISAFVGIDFKKHPEAIHAIYQEFGDGHSPRFPDPFVRPAFDENRAKIRAIQKKVLKKWGMPIE